MTNHTAAAEAARENARRADGKFGAQARAEADIDLGSSPAAPLDPSHPDSALNRASEDAYTALKQRMAVVAEHREKMAARHIARTLKDRWPTAARITLEEVSGDEGSFMRPMRVMDRDGDVLDFDAYNIRLDGNRDLGGYLDRCDLRRLSSATGFGNTGGAKSYYDYLDLDVAVELDVTPPAELTDPTRRPLGADAQAELVEIASTGIEEKWDYLHQYGAEDHGAELPEVRAEWAQNEVLVSPLAPGESRQGAAAQVLLERHRKYTGDTLDTLVVELGDPDDEPSGHIVSGTGFDGTEISQDQTLSLDKDYVLAQQIAHLELDTLDEQALEVSGISIDGRTVTIRNTSPLAQHARAKRDVQS